VGARLYDHALTQSTSLKSSWFAKTKAVASLWRSRDELSVAPKPPTQRPRVRALGLSQGPDGIASAPRQSTSEAPAVADARTRRLRATLGGRDGDGRNYQRCGLTHSKCPGFWIEGCLWHSSLVSVLASSLGSAAVRGPSEKSNATEAALVGGAARLAR
jgi:hypothetical protein